MSVEYLSSKSIGFRHGFFTRHGGISENQFASLNATPRVGDSAKNVSVNRARALSALKLDPSEFAFLDHLEHADKILAVTKAARGLDFNGYDVIMTNEGSISLGLSVADCPAIILASEKDGAVAIVHSGWRGTRSNVIPKAVQAMQQEYGIAPKNLKSVIGPAISVQSYEIGEDVEKQFDQRYIVDRELKKYLDLGMIIEDQLIESGVRAIDNLSVDTFTDDRFFSYRRENGDTGRNLVVVTL